MIALFSLAEKLNPIRTEQTTMSWKRIVPYYIPLVPRMGVKYNMSNYADKHLYTIPTSGMTELTSKAKRNHFERCQGYHDERMIPHEEFPHMYLGTFARFGFWFTAEHVIPQFPCVVFNTGAGTFTITASLCTVVAYFSNLPGWRREFLNISRLNTLERIRN